MADVILFGGTTEGRLIADMLVSRHLHAVVCVATDYGRTLLPTGENLDVRTGRMDENAIVDLLHAEKPRLVIDATHPYASTASGNIYAACLGASVPYARIRRERIQRTEEEESLLFPDMEALISWLNTTSDTVFSTLGAKEAAALTSVRCFSERLWLRILPSAGGLAACLSAGFSPRHIICMQGPFSTELNAAMFKESGASVLITKESGPEGGFPQKLEAARLCGMKVAVLERPRESEGVTLGEIRTMIEKGEI